MADLTDRQLAILKAIIEEYIETAEAVGSEFLDKKHNLGVSPATLRNEMVALMKTGYLKQPHTSAGRVPTPMALKFYVHNLMQEKQLSVADEVKIKQKIWDSRQEVEKLLREATHALAEKTNILAIATLDNNDLYYAGMGNILDMPEFLDIDLTKNLLLLLDQVDFWKKLVGQAIETGNPIHMILGDEMGFDYLEPCGFVYTHYNLGRHSGAIGVVGPIRLDYQMIIPLVRYMGNLLEEIA